MKLFTKNYLPRRQPGSLQTRRSFTLLELLVVIGIISILVAIGSVSFSTAQKKARDVRRQSDLKDIQSAFEQYYSLNNYQYPVTSGNLSGDLIYSGSTLIKMPKGPTGEYYTCQTCTATGYTIRAILEQPATTLELSNRQ